jgi:hypothetical protein
VGNGRKKAQKAQKMEGAFRQLFEPHFTANPQIVF